MEVKVQKLESAMNEVTKDVQEKENRINKLEAEMRTTVAASELTQLQAKLDETEKRLETILRVNQSLQV